MAPETAVDTKQVVINARAYLTELGFGKGREVELEEVEPTSDDGWQITFSYERFDEDPLGIRHFLPAKGSSRVYKIVKVDSSGNPQSVKIR